MEGLDVLETLVVLDRGGRRGDGTGGVRQWRSRAGSIEVKARVEKFRAADWRWDWRGERKVDCRRVDSGEKRQKRRTGQKGRRRKSGEGLEERLEENFGGVGMGGEIFGMRLRRCSSARDNCIKGLKRITPDYAEFAWISVYRVEAKRD